MENIRVGVAYVLLEKIRKKTEKKSTSKGFLFQQIVYVLSDCEWSTNKLARGIRNLNLKCILDCRSLERLKKSLSLQRFKMDYKVIRTKKLQKKRTPKE